MAEIRYVSMGQAERSRIRRGKPCFTWHEGWSENGTHMPWLTKREAQVDAKARGSRAVFVRSGRGSAA